MQNFTSKIFHDKTNKVSFTTFIYKTLKHRQNERKKSFVCLKNAEQEPNRFLFQFFPQQNFIEQINIVTNVTVKMINRSLYIHTKPTRKNEHINFWFDCSVKHVKQKR